MKTCLFEIFKGKQIILWNLIKHSKNVTFVIHHFIIFEGQKWWIYNSKFQNSRNNFRTIVITVNSFQCMFLKVINIWKFRQQSSQVKYTWYYPTSSRLSFESPPKLPSFPSKFHQNPTRSFPVYFGHFRAQNLDWGETKHFHHHHSHYPEKNSWSKYYAEFINESTFLFWKVLLLLQ